MSEPAIIAAARAAWGRIRRNATFNDWIAVAKALALGRAECMRLAACNKPMGARYNAAMGQWLAQHSLDGITTQERYRALLVLDNLAAIETWRAGLDDPKRRRLNHPGAIWSHWRASVCAKTIDAGSHQDAPHRVAENGRPPKGQHGRAVFWPGDMIARGAEAIRECRSSDTITLARRCLEAAVRGTVDIDKLLATQGSKPQAPRIIAALIGASV